MNVFWGELIGTMLLILLGNGAVANVLLTRSKGYHSGWIVITAGWGFAVAVSVYVVGWASGGHLNPAITLALTLTGKSPYGLLWTYLIGQILGALIGALLVWIAYFPHWAATPDPTQKLLCFATQPAIRKPFANFICEAIGTMVLVLGVLGIFDHHNTLAGGIGAFAVGMLVFAIGLSLGGPTGYAINPARDLGPRIVYAFLPMKGKGSSDWNYAWVPVMGPLVGGLIGALIYQQLIEILPSLG